MKKGILFLLGCFLGVACKQPYYEESGTVFHTVYHIKYQSNRLLSKEMEAELQAFDLSLNPFNPRSILAKVNRNEEVEVDEWFKTVFNKAMEVSALSDGLFDVTVAPLINLWGFGFERKDSISPQLIDSLKTWVGYRKIRLNGNRVVKDDPRILLNFSAIAKGYACDVLAALLERQGVENYMVEIGGEVVARGVNPNGDCWRVGVDKPQEDGGANREIMKEIFRLCGKCGMATSGNYRNFYIRDGKKYAHTIHPHTGYPSEQDILSATIVAPDCMTADAFATAFMVMGAEAACRMAEQIPDVEYYIICDGGNHTFQTRYSDGVRSLIAGDKNKRNL